jgi:hypothetical protein
MPRNITVQQNSSSAVLIRMSCRKATLHRDAHGDCRRKETAALHDTEKESLPKEVRLSPGILLEHKIKTRWIEI